MPKPRKTTVGADFGDVFFQPRGAFVGVIKAGAGPAARGLAAPGEIAHDEVAIGELLVDPRLEIAVGALALEEGVAEEEDAVAVLDFKRLGGAREEGDEDEEGDEEGEAHGDIEGRDVSPEMNPGASTSREEM